MTPAVLAAAQTAQAAAHAAETAAGAAWLAAGSVVAKPKPPAPKKALPMMLQAQNSFVPPKDAGKHEDPPYLGTIPKFAPDKRAALTGRQVAGGTDLDSMPDSGPWLDQRFAGPCVGKSGTHGALRVMRKSSMLCASTEHLEDSGSIRSTEAFQSRQGG